MIHPPAPHGSYSDHHGHWRTGEAVEVDDAEVARKAADFPGCFEVAPGAGEDPPIVNAAIITSPEMTTEIDQPPRRRSSSRSGTKRAR